MNSTFGMFVKYPEPGQVKTRLAATLGKSAAADLYRAFLRDLIARFRATGQRRVLAYSPSNDLTREFFSDLASHEYELWPQPSVDLGRRMQAFFEMFGPGPAVLVGSDSPTLPQDFVSTAFQMLDTAEVVLGPATDGGLYLIGLNQWQRSWPIFEGIDWSTSKVLDQIVRRLSAERARVAVLPLWYDIDESGDLDFLRGHLSASQLAGVSSFADAPATESALNRVLEWMS